MVTVTINRPIWNGGQRKVGIAEYKIRGDLRVEIEHRLSTGDRLYPYPFFITAAEALRYPVQYVKGVKLRIIPLDDMRAEL